MTFIIVRQWYFGFSVILLVYLTFAYKSSLFFKTSWPNPPRSKYETKVGDKLSLDVCNIQKFGDETIHVTGSLMLGLNRYANWFLLVPLVKALKVALSKSSQYLLGTPPSPPITFPIIMYSKLYYEWLWKKN